MAVTHYPAVTTWSDFRLEDGHTDDGIGLDLSSLGPFTFSRAAFRKVVLDAVGLLDALDAEDRVAEREHHRSRTPRGLWERFLRR